MEDRLDVQFHHPAHRDLERQLRASPYPVRRLRDIAIRLVDGPFGSQLKVSEYVDTGIPLIRVADTVTGEIEDKGLVFITQKKQEQLKRSQVLPGDILLAKAGSLGFCAIFPGRWPEGNITSHLACIRCTEEVRNQYLSTYLTSSMGLTQIYRWGNKTTRPELNTQEVGSILVIVPPLDVQDTVATMMSAAHQGKRELEAEARELLASIDGYLLERLGVKLPELSDRNHFVQSAYAARGGRLDPYHYQRRFIESLKALHASEYPTLAVGDLVTSISGGSTPLGAQYPEKGIPFLRIQNITEGSIDLSDIRFISPTTHRSMKRSQLKPLDVLMTITGRVGTSAVVPSDFGDGNINQHIVRMAITPRGNPFFVSEVLNCSVGRVQVERGVTGTTRIALDYPSILSIEIPLPPLDVQETVVSEVHSRRSRARSLRAEAQRIVSETRAEVERIILGK